MSNLTTEFLNGATIAYRNLGYERGDVIAKWDADAEAWGTAFTAVMVEGGRWVERTRPIADADFDWQKMSVARARYAFPTDARLA